MNSIKIIRRVNYMYKCACCGSDNVAPSYSVLVDINGNDRGPDLRFSLCPECAILISHELHEAVNKNPWRHSGIDIQGISYEEYHSIKNDI